MSDFIPLVPKSIIFELKENADNLLDIILEEPLYSKPSEAESEFFDILITLSQISPECRKFADDCVSNYNFFQKEKGTQPAGITSYQNSI